MQLKTFIEIHIFLTLNTITILFYTPALAAIYHYMKRPGVYKCNWPWTVHDVILNIVAAMDKAEQL